MTTRVCPTCGTIDYGLSFCVSCQEPLRWSSAIFFEDMDIQTPEQPVMEKAGFFRRFAAFFIDWVLLSIIADIFRFAYSVGSSDHGRMIPLNFAMGLSTFLFILYFALLTGDGGQTLGKMLLKVRVQTLDGSPVGYGRSLLRTLGYFVSIFFGSFLGFLWALWDKKNQTWHDKIAGTEVIKI